MTNNTHSAIPRPRRKIDRRPLVVLAAIVAALAVIAIVDSLKANSTDSNSEVIVSTPGDWKSGLDRLNRIENELFTNPDPTRVDEIMVPACSCYADTKTRLTTLQTNKQHVAGDNVRIDFTSLTKEESPDRVIAFVVLSDNGKPIVDANGSVVSESPKADRVGAQYTLVRGDDKQWRIADRGPIKDVEVN